MTFSEPPAKMKFDGHARAYGGAVQVAILPCKNELIKAFALFYTTNAIAIASILVVLPSNHRLQNNE